MNQRDVRNFVIIAHVDHGKSTLADRFLDITGTVEGRKMHAQYLDTMDIEQERGITIKMQPVRMEYKGESKKGQGGEKPFAFTLYALNLIDTPGHVDFTYEVSRSLAAVEGALLLVDATKGIQAQTLANMRLAQREGLIIIPAINKIDLPNANPQKVSEELAAVLGIDAANISRVSAKESTGVEELLSRVVREVPPPRGSDTQPLRALIFDSTFDAFKGVIVYVRVVDGSVKRCDKIRFLASGAVCEVLEVGYFKPERTSCEELTAGDIGYIATGVREVSKCRVGDTITSRTTADFTRTHAENVPRKSASGQRESTYVEPLPGYAEPRPMVFASFYPTQGDDFAALKDALSKLKLNDAALTYEPESSEALGRGFRCGFLGMLHLEIAKERLLREFNIDLVVTPPSVLYKVIVQDGSVLDIATAAFMPDPSRIKEIQEPWVVLEVVTPLAYLGGVMELARSFRAEYRDTEYLSQDHMVVSYHVPLGEIVTNFYDRLKSVSSGYASMNYTFGEYKAGDLVKLDILVAGEKMEALSHIVPRVSAQERGRRIVSRLKDLIPRQLFVVALQAAVGGTILARETISAMRKDVTGYLYGGDVTRKKKLLEKQKRCEKRMKAAGRVNIPPNVFLEMLKE